MRFSINSNAAAVGRSLQAGARKFPAQVAAGLNRTARAVEQHELVEMERRLDRPTPFTLDAFVLKKATPGNLVVELRIKPIQASYLRHAIFGGRLKANVTPVLANARLNLYGNLPGKRRGLAGVAGRAKTKFVGEINGRFGVWQRYGRGGSKVRLLAYVARNVQRTKRWDFLGIAQRVVDERLARDVRAAIAASR